MTYAIDKVLKTFESKLKKLDTALNKLDDFKVNVKSDLHQEIITVLRDERQVFHLVVADSLTKYVSELQDALKQSTQALCSHKSTLMQWSRNCNVYNMNGIIITAVVIVMSNSNERDKFHKRVPYDAKEIAFVLSE
jgi:hypothetical protein